MLAAEKRRLVLMLRWVLMVALSYLVVFDGHTSIELAGLSACLFLASNLALMRLPERVFDHRSFDVLLLVVDVTLITTSLWLCGSGGSDFFFLFFFVLFLAALGDRPELVALGATLAALAYLCLIYNRPLLDSATLLRVPFLFITGLTYGYLASCAREARARAQAAESALGTMSQDLRTPLSLILRYSEALRADRLPNLTAEQREQITKINAEAVELLGLIVRRLLDVPNSRPLAESGPEGAAPDIEARGKAIYSSGGDAGIRVALPR
jgi:signal transduction histidine kinase